MVVLHEGTPLPGQHRTNTFATSITVTERQFAPGHLGELTRQVPFELIDEILERTRMCSTVCVSYRHGSGFTSYWPSRCSRCLATRGCGTNSRPGCPERSLARRRRRCVICGTDSARLRCNCCFEAVAGPVALPTTPGVCYRGWRTVAFDGCSSSKAPDRPAILAWLGKHRHRYTAQTAIRCSRSWPCARPVPGR